MYVMVGRSMADHALYGDDDNSKFQLPDCLWTEVFHRLPLKSVFRYRCVSKTWFSLLSDPHFLHCRLSQCEAFWSSPPPAWSLIFRFKQFFGAQNSLPNKYNGTHFITSGDHSQDHEVLPFSLSFLPPDQEPPPDKRNQLQIIASSDDLFLCRASVDYRSIYYICNPFTNEWVELPVPLTLAQVWGEGLIAQVDVNGVVQYKVVLLLSGCGASKSLNMDVFSSQTGKWTSFEVNCPYHYSFGKGNPLYRAIPCNGILHWIDDYFGVIIAYDPNKNMNQCRFIELPEKRKNNRLGGLNGILSVCHGKLRYFEVDTIHIGRHGFQSWTTSVLEDYAKGEWHVEHNVEMCTFGNAFLDIDTNRILIPLAFHPFDVDIMYFWRPGYILSYNLRSRRFEGEKYAIADVGLLCWWVVIPFVLPAWLTEARRACQRIINPGGELGMGSECQDLKLKQGKLTRKGFKWKLFDVFFSQHYGRGNSTRIQGSAPTS